jgi:hypothetical protein
VIARGDLAHLTLMLWAGAASLLAAWLLRELASANRRFDAFVRELHHFNSRLGGQD